MAINLKFWMKIFLSLGLVALIFTRLDSSALLRQLEQLDGPLWALAVVFMSVQVFALALRWKLLVDGAHRKISYPEALQITLASLLANFLFITSVGGVLAKIALTSQHGVSMVKSVCAAMIDRFLTLFALIFLAALFVPFMPLYIQGIGYEVITLGVAASTALAFVVVPLFFQRVLRQKILASRKYAAAAHYMRKVLLDPSLFLRLALVSVAGQLVYFVAIYSLTLATDVSISPLGLLTVLPAITLVASLPIGFGGWGVREGAFVFGLGLLGVPHEAAFLISVQVGIMSMLSTMLVSVPSIIGNDSGALKAQEALAAQRCGRLFAR